MFYGTMVLADDNDIEFIWHFPTEYRTFGVQIHVEAKNILTPNEQVLSRLGYMGPFTSMLFDGSTNVEQSYFYLTTNVF